MTTSTHPPQTKGVRPAVFCFALFSLCDLHVALLLCIKQGKVRTKTYKEINTVQLSSVHPEALSIIFVEYDKIKIKIIKRRKSYTENHS